MKLATYGNYLGNRYNRYPAVPVDELDFCCFMHDIDHQLSCSNNRYADMELGARLLLVDFSKLSTKGKIVYLLAKHLYTGLYATILRGIIKPNPIELEKWESSKQKRIARYKQNCIWQEYKMFLEKILSNVVMSEEIKITPHDYEI